MKVTRHHGTVMRRVLAGMIQDSTVCGRIASQWSGNGLFDVPWANLVAGWAIRHLRKYNTAIGSDLRPTFDTWATGTKAPEETIKAIESFLTHLSREEGTNDYSSDYLLDCAGDHFNSIRLKRVMEEAEEELERGRCSQAQDILHQSGKVELGVGALVKPADDLEVWIRAFDEENERPLFGYPGRLNYFLGRWMQRDSFIAFMGPDKSGKSMWLLDAVYRGIRARKRVVFFECGDMSEVQVIRRLGQRIMKRPRRKSTVEIPIKFEGDEVEYRSRVCSKNLSPRACYKALRKWTGGRDTFRMACYPNSTVSVTDLLSTLRSWEVDGWVPDIVVADYADILAPPPGSDDGLDQIDMTWKLLRRLSQEYHCLVLTATQSSAAAYNTKTLLGKKHFSGRKTKLAHVTGMVGLNVSTIDKQRGVTRLNWVVRREGAYDDAKALSVAGCLAIACPAMKSE